MDNIYSAYHYSCKTKADREAIEALKPQIDEAAQKAVWGNIGDIKYTTRTEEPNGGFWCNGQVIDKSTAPDAYQMLVDGKLQSVDIDTYNSVVELNGSCGFFGLDSANECFRIPLLKDVYLKAGQEAETFGAESLPNIKGTGGYDTNTNEVGSYWSGAFAYTDTSDQGVNGDGGASALFTFDASRSSPTYKDGAKVNPDHVKYRAYVILFNAVKDVSIGNYTSILTKTTQEGVNTLNSKTLSGMSDLANASNALRTTQITNCITEIPQDVKLELNDGVLSAKVGSKIRYPNGKNADGSLRFDEIVIESDISLTQSWGSSQTFLLFYDTKGSRLRIYDTGRCYSGTASVSDGAYYNTNDNKLCVYDGGSLNYEASLPIAVITGQSPTITSIDQVFNGFGYIGSTLFALPGVKGLIPNGRNADGSLRNVEFMTSKVLTNTYNDSASASFYFQVNETYAGRANTGYWKYDKRENLTYWNDNGVWKNKSVVLYGSLRFDSGKITLVEIPLSFRAVDYNDMYKKEDIVSWGMPSSQYIDLGTVTSYTAPADGIISWLTGSLGDWNQAEATVGNRKYYFYTFGNTGKGGWFEINKGEKVTFNTSSTSYKRFVYKKGVI